jgi:hypothetical protein
MEARAFTGPGNKEQVCKYPGQWNFIQFSPANSVGCAVIVCSSTLRTKFTLKRSASEPPPQKDVENPKRYYNRI